MDSAASAAALPPIFTVKADIADRQLGANTGSQLGSIPVAEDKARTSVLFRRPSKAFEDAIASGGIGLRVLGLRGATPYDGGVPILVDGKIIGAIGVSGVLPKQDGQVANAGCQQVEINEVATAAADEAWYAGVAKTPLGDWSWKRARHE